MITHSREIYVYNESGELVDKFDTCVLAAREYNVVPSTINFRVKKGGYYNGLRFVGKENSSIYTKKMKPLKDTENYFIGYEARGKICLSNCPYKQDIKIGSRLCQTCNSFKGIDRDKHLVVCIHKKV